MTVLWSPHAETLLDDIVIGIAEALSVDDGLRWEGKLRNAAADIGEFPFSGPIVPVECFHTIPANADRLRQVIVKPYRLVYEPVGDEVHILSIRHSRMLVTMDDTAWN
ncbi:MAG: type II toxin-antitoxin system RelE/ParE family toxin [Kiritimatiellae bacterium]|nr:type II toxin-antitoxin system RelE/ParE family toxin [Kiritimatiellia bacterium]